MNIKNPPATMADVRGASERYGEVQWPDSIRADKKAEILAIVADIEVDGGLRTIRAKRKLAEQGYAALFGIVEKLRTLDYGNVDDAGLGFELNKLLEEILVDMNARYEPVQANEEIHPAKAEWNTRTVNAWMKVLSRWPDEATFKKQRAERLRKKNG
ncbi:MAG TPA: hypothetical protein ENI87_10460 [bacterium]|nr:hypothetical protein [bacterium]